MVILNDIGVKKDEFMDAKQWEICKDSNTVNDVAN